MVQIKTLRSVIKRQINLILATFGLRLASKNAVPSWDVFFEQLKKNNFQPNTVVDVGVAKGTPWLYRAFPEAHFYLVDPLRESLHHMKRVGNDYDVTILNIGLGSKKSKLDIKVNLEDIGSSSMKEVSSNEILSNEKIYSVDVERMDQCIRHFPSPALCKIDVQGAELDVLEGMSGCINNFDVIIIECQVLNTIPNAPCVADIIEFLHSHEFSLYDILAIGRRPLDASLAEVDLAFVKTDSVFRSDNSWT
jgi:FkbM family methyltransferase